MSSQPSPRADALRAMREARYELNQRRMREERGKTVATPAPVAAVKTKPAAKKKKSAKSSRSRG